MIKSNFSFQPSGPQSTFYSRCVAEDPWEKKKQNIYVHVCASMLANDKYVPAMFSESPSRQEGPSDRIHNRDRHSLFPDNVNSSRVKSFVTEAEWL